MAKKKKNKTDRKLELSTAFLEMGAALMKEGTEANEYTIKQLGNILIFLSGISLDEKDVYDFSELCSMFSAKKLVENLIKENGMLDTQNISYEDFIKKMKDINNDNFGEKND